MISGLLSLLDPVRFCKFLKSALYQLVTFSFHHPTKAAAIFATFAALETLRRACAPLQ